MSSFFHVSHLSRRARVTGALISLPGVLGFALFVWLGDSFLPRHDFTPAWLIALCMVAGAVCFYVLRQIGAAPAIQTSWVVWVAWPFFTLVFGGAWIFAIQGWVMGASRALASGESSTYELVLLQSGPSESRRSPCMNQAEFRVFDTTAHRCLDDYLVGLPIRPGMTLMATGRASPLGMHMTRIEAR